MKIKFICLLCMTLSILIISCQKKSQKVKPILNEVKNIMELKPDSALILLENINDIKNLKKSLLNNYYLLHIQAKDKCYKDITSDTTIFKEGQNNFNDLFIDFSYYFKPTKGKLKYKFEVRNILDHSEIIRYNNNDISLVKNSYKIHPRQFIFTVSLGL